MLVIVYFTMDDGKRSIRKALALFRRVRERKCGI